MIEKNYRIKLGKWCRTIITEKGTLYQCSECGNIKKDLKLSDRIYHCDCCGLIIDRDFNASLNLARYNLA